MSVAKRFFSQSLNAHKWLGLLVGALMYLICLSGTLAVYFEELERWEQPHAEEYLDYDPRVLDEAFNRFLIEQNELVTPHMYLTLPTDVVPRAGISTEQQGWYLNTDGSTGSSTAHPFTDLITDLHIYLHLPEAWGVIVVSALGAMLLGLIISGLCSHRTIVKDAFKFRIFGSKQLEQTDLHNRLSVWGAPFHIMIAITGAYFGLAMIVLVAYSQLFNDGDVNDLTKQVFGSEPELNLPVNGIAIGSMLEQMPELAPGTKPLFVIVHDAGTPKQFAEVFTQYPNRLIYSDNFVFSPSGEFLSSRNFSEGDFSKQVVYSMYRLHFGHFGGWGVKVLYALLGLALTVISVSGINIWLAKRKHVDSLNFIWPGFVWGAPMGIAVAGISRFAFGYIENWIFWATIVACCSYGLVVKNESKVSMTLKAALFISILGLLAAYFSYAQESFNNPSSLNVTYVLVTSLVAAIAFKVAKGRLNSNSIVS